MLVTLMSNVLYLFPVKVARKCRYRYNGMTSSDVNKCLRKFSSKCNQKWPKPRSHPKVVQNIPLVITQTYKHGKIPLTSCHSSSCHLYFFTDTNNIGHGTQTLLCSFNCNSCANGNVPVKPVLYTVSELRQGKKKKRACLQILLKRMNNLTVMVW